MRTRPNTVRRSLAYVAGAALLFAPVLTACGDDSVPTKAEFSAAVKPTLGASISSSLKVAGVSEAKTSKIIDEFIDCVYRELETQPDLLKAATLAPPVSDPSSQSTQLALEKQAQACTSKLNAAVSAATSKGATP